MHIFYDLPGDEKAISIVLIISVVSSILIAGDDGSTLKVIILAFFISCVLCLAWYAITIPVRKRAAKAAEEIAKRNALAEAKTKFYDECLKAGITELDTAEKEEKAKLIARRLGIDDGTDLASLLMEKNDEAAKAKEAKERKKRQELIQNEQKQHNELTKYAHLTGREKRIRILTDQQDEMKKQLAQLRQQSQGSNTLARATQQKEQSWATHGGIASGIAGPAAGLVTAMNVEAKNAEIRAQNQAYMQAFAYRGINLAGRISYYEKAIAEADEEISCAQAKMVAETAKEELIKLLSIKKPNVEISDTGAFKIQAKIERKGEIKVFNDLKTEAVIDGTISADLYQEGKKRGSALLVLPVFGLGPAVTVEGMGLNGAKKDVAYEIKFTPYHLWAMER